MAAEDKSARQPLARPDAAAMRAHLEDFKSFKAARPAHAVARALDELARSAHDSRHNVFGAVVEAAEAGCTHGEICAVLRRELGFGHVQAMV
jgi:methylmalonyl-CoA mutase N-terminal domain/subunit